MCARCVPCRVCFDLVLGDTGNRVHANRIAPYTLVHITTMFKKYITVLDEIHPCIQLNYTIRLHNKSSGTHNHFYIELYLPTRGVVTNNTTMFRNHSIANSMDPMIKGAVYQMANNADRRDEKKSLFIAIASIWELQFHFYWIISHGTCFVQ